MPEVLSRPVIVNLWGMTGVGTTDLIRRLVKVLDLQDRFCEVELSNGDTTAWLSSVGSVLDANANHLRRGRSWDARRSTRSSASTPSMAI